MLHTPEEIVRLSNLAHFWEGATLIIIALLVAAKAFGYLRTGWQEYLWPLAALAASLTLFGFLFVGHFGELGKAWRVLTTDIQQKQHLTMGLVLAAGAVIELLAIKLKNRWLHLVFPLSILIIGILFLTHPQHGGAELAQQAAAIHKLIGIGLIFGALAQAAAWLFEKYRQALLVILALALVFSAGLFMAYREPLVLIDHMYKSKAEH